LLLHF